ncbi:MAG: hypothetical protein JNN25_07665 [Candidatus Kapabacteria bacterium]|nr:hypothetical protein [Candidatus Kapabacteria bacterium]
MKTTLKTIASFILLIIALPLTAQRLQWQSVNGQEITISDIQTVNGLANIGERILLAATNKGILCSFDAGQNWEQRNRGLSTTDTRTITTLGNIIFCGEFGSISMQGMFMSIDTAKTWQKIWDGSPTRFLLLKGSNIYTNSGSTAFESRNSGKSFQRLQIDSVFCSGIFVHDNILYANGAISKRDNFGNYFVTSFLFQSLDSGKSWKKVMERPFPWFPSNFLRIDSLMFFTQDPFQESPGTIHRARFADTVWKSLSLPNEQKFTYIPAFHSVEKKLFCFDGTAGLHSSNDLGETWQLDNNGLPSKPFIIQFVTIGNFLYAVGSVPGKGGIIYRASLSPLTAVEREHRLVASEVFPNPATETVSFRVHLPTSARVDVRLYNSVGSLVLERITVWASAGEFETLLPVGTLPNGTYTRIVWYFGIHRTHSFVDWVLSIVQEDARG